MLIRKIDLARAHIDHDREILRREWLITNGLGGYASGTISGMVSRRYHGLLIAALPAPLGRVVMLNHLSETIRMQDGRKFPIGGEETVRAGDGAPEMHYVKQFRIEHGLPVWVYEAEDCVIEKRLLLIHGQNTVHAGYRLLSAPGTVRLELRPSVHFRFHENNVSESMKESYALLIRDGCYEISNPGLPRALNLHMRGESCGFTYNGGTTREIDYPAEAERGYPSRGSLWSPGFFHVELRGDKEATFIASTEASQTMRALSPKAALEADVERRMRLVSMSAPAAQSGPGAELVLAADQFIIQPAGRMEDSARARAMGDDVRTVIAGYHWFTDWGRDTMISLEGLTITTGRHAEAGWILRTFAQYVRDGLIPNLFPEGKSDGLYHTADATLWFFHAVDRYLEATGDRVTLQMLLPKLREIVDAHLRGTKFGIGVDPKDGLLRQGEEGYQLTWMDAKVDGWVVTPRRGKAVEINALWYNALRLFEGWLREENADDADVYAAHAARAYESFNRRFWSDRLQYLFDVVDGENGDDSACRPNQIFSISLPHSVLDQKRWPAVLEKVRTELLTPYGLRSLSRDHPDYKARYFGDLRARDAAYHQGTVWAWLIGPFIDAWLKVHPGQTPEARKWLEPLCAHLDHACVGTINEIFDAEEPYTPRGCIAQAWSVAEALRCWVKTAAPGGE
ncbi:MAG TPA: amylo-alpha-1,6-glucosidase [Chthoniobacteraceae bacterium]|nr:amylo-alpha-1,6-glucosidase [Chthoniobacteraceae bacterium]